MIEIAKRLQGQLPATLHMGAGDTNLARRLLPV
jgi:hypothetical protein